MAKIDAAMWEAAKKAVAENNGVVCGDCFDKILDEVFDALVNCQAVMFLNKNKKMVVYQFEKIN